MVISRKHLLVLTLLVSFVFSATTKTLEYEESDETELGMKFMYKEMMGFIKLSNAERQLTNAEIRDMKNNLAELKTSTSEDSKHKIKLLTEIKNVIPEDRKGMSKLLEGLKNTIVELWTDEVRKLKEAIDGMKEKSEGNYREIAEELTEMQIKFEKLVTKDDVKETLDEENKAITENVRILPVKDTKAAKDKFLSRPRDCWDLHQSGEKQNGVFEIFPSGTSDGSGFKVSCDMETDGGGWTVFQRRGQYGNSASYFYKSWSDYKKGFGDLDKEFWLGNDKLSTLTNQNMYQLRVDLMCRNNTTAFAKYNTFKADNETHFYRLTVGEYSGNAGDSMKRHNGMFFSTKDVDNDRWSSGNCAEDRRGAWWYKDCHDSNLNGLNLNGGPSYDWKGIMWNRWEDNYSLRASEMKIRP